jgi:hypothetical protein
MCLETVDSKEETIKKYGKEGYGWKVFRKYKDGIRAECYPGGESLYIIGKRYKSKPSDNTPYPCGFHIFWTRRAARRWAMWPSPNSHFFLGLSRLVVRKVKWSGPRASGTQWNKKVIVAKHMTILPLKEKKK